MKDITVNIQALTQFMEREGTSRVPSAHVETVADCPVRLGYWISYVRSNYRAGRLSQGTVDALGGLPGFEWGPFKTGPKGKFDVRDSEIRTEREKGDSLATIARNHGISRQRVHQILS